MALGKKGVVAGLGSAGDPRQPPHYAGGSRGLHWGEPRLESGVWGWGQRGGKAL